MITHPIDLFIMDPKSKEDNVNVTNLKNFPTFEYKKNIHATHLVELLDKMCKYEMDAVSIVEDTERTDGHLLVSTNPQHDASLRTDGQTDKSKRVYPLQLCWWGGCIIKLYEL